MSHSSACVWVFSLMGCIASVFLDRVKEMANRIGISAHQVLGYAMAHELGHLLLGSNSHSSRGLMQAKWSNQELRPSAGLTDLVRWVS